MDKSGLGGDLFRYDGESAAMFSGTGRLDGSIQGQKIGFSHRSMALLTW